MINTFLKINIGLLQNINNNNLSIDFNIIKDSDNNILFHENDLPNNNDFKLEINKLNNHIEIYILINWTNIKKQILSNNLIKHRYYLFLILKKKLGVKKEPNYNTPIWFNYYELNNYKPKTIQLWNSDFYYYDKILFNLNTEEIINNLNLIDYTMINCKIISIENQFILYNFLLSKPTKLLAIVSYHHYQLLLNLFQKLNLNFNELNYFTDFDSTKINIITTNKIISNLKNIFNDVFKLSKISTTQKLKIIWDDTMGKYPLFINVQNLLIDKNIFNEQVFKNLFKYWNIKNYYFIGEYNCNKLLELIYTPDKLYKQKTLYKNKEITFKNWLYQHIFYKYDHTFDIKINSFNLLINGYIGEIICYLFNENINVWVPFENENKVNINKLKEKKLKFQIQLSENEDFGHDVLRKLKLSLNKIYEEVKQFDISNHCPISLQKIDKSKSYLPCGHCFDFISIFKWVKDNFNCPLCKINCSISDIILNKNISINPLINNLLYLHKNSTLVSSSDWLVNKLLQCKNSQFVANNFTIINLIKLENLSYKKITNNIYFLDNYDLNSIKIISSLENNKFIFYKIN